VVNVLGGHSIRVGTGAATEARFELDSPAAVRDWLAGLALADRGHGGLG
jgi:hypothetical protein